MSTISPPPFIGNIINNFSVSVVIYLISSFYIQLGFNDVLNKIKPYSYFFRL
ncbi:hypothetical protein EIN_182130, partial [Entamoeba invadens IP1]|uniref:hypothetical protein n=1 Tax=Entamoeba invadens IP1 TaxID=370355 RepID=UPI0002C3DAD2